MLHEIKGIPRSFIAIDFTRGGDTVTKKVTNQYGSTWEFQTLKMRNKNYLGLYKD